MRSTLAAGIGLVVIGIIILAVGAVLMFSGGTQTSTNLLASNNYNIAAGDNQAIGFTVPADTKVAGTFTQTNGTSVNFIFMTANQQNAFGNCAPCSSPSIENVSSLKTYDFNWSINTTGSYYIVLDNSNGGSAVAVQLSANSVSSNSSGSMISTYLIILGIIVVVVGAIVAAMSSQKPKAQEQKVAKVSESQSTEAVRKDDKS